MTAPGRMMGGDRLAIGLALLFVAGLGGLEFGLYRPQRARLAAAEAELAGVQQQLMAVDRRRQLDEQALRAVGTEADGEGLRRLLSMENGLVYLNRRIDEARVRRVDFRTENSGTDGPFQVERFFITVDGPGTRLLEFVHTLELSPRLARFEQIRIEPQPESVNLTMRARVSIYSLPPGGMP